jgi:hypothetical protein
MRKAVSDPPGLCLTTEPAPKHLPPFYLLCPKVLKEPKNILIMKIELLRRENPLIDKETFG